MILLRSIFNIIYQCFVVYLNHSSQFSFHLENRRREKRKIKSYMPISRILHKIKKLFSTCRKKLFSTYAIIYTKDLLKKKSSYVDAVVLRLDVLR